MEMSSSFSVRDAEEKRTQRGRADAGREAAEPSEAAKRAAGQGRRQQSTRERAEHRSHLHHKTCLQFLRNLTAVASFRNQKSEGQRRGKATPESFRRQESEGAIATERRRAKASEDEGRKAQRLGEATRENNQSPKENLFSFKPDIRRATEAYHLGARRTGRSSRLPSRRGIATRGAESS